MGGKVAPDGRDAGAAGTGPAPARHRRPRRTVRREHPRGPTRLAQSAVLAVAATLGVQWAATSLTPAAGRAVAGAAHGDRSGPTATTPATAPTTPGAPTSTATTTTTPAPTTITTTTTPVTAPTAASTSTPTPTTASTGSTTTSTTAAGTTPTSTPSNAGPQAGAADLAAEVASYLAGRTDVVAAAVEDLTTGRTWTLAAGPPQHTASVVKLEILETLLSQLRTGGLPTATTQALAASMIEESTNTAAQSLFTQVGGAAGLAAYGTTVGLAGTTPTWIWGLTTTTPADQLALLRAVATTTSPLDAAQRTYALGLLENVVPTQSWGVTGGVPGGVTVALKDGWVTLATTTGDWQANSVGWIDGDGADYVLAVLTTGNATLGYGQTTIEGVSAIVWDALGSAGDTATTATTAG